MGLFDDVFDTFGSIVSGVFSGPATSGSYLGGSGGPSSSFLPLGNYGGQAYPDIYSQPQAMPVMSTMPAVVGGVGRSLARFPALAGALMALSQQFGKRFTPDIVWRMLKNNGPGLVGGLIGGAAMNELAIWKSTHKSRRMNVANTKALRRSVRRLKGFDRLSHRVSSQLTRVGGRGRTRRSSRCTTCRKSPCSC